MSPPPIQLFTTSIIMNPVLRQRQEYLLRILQIRKVPHTVYDLSADEGAKRLWRRKAPQGKQELPGILIGGVWPGGFAEFEEAVEFDELDTFLRLDDTYDPELDMLPPMPQQTIGVPGSLLPSQTAPLKSPSASPAQASKSGTEKAKAAVNDDDLEGIQVTEDEIAQLLESMGLETKERGTAVGEEATATTAEMAKPPTAAGDLGKEAAKIAQQRAEAKKSSADGTKPLALRKASSTAAPVESEAAPETAPQAVEGESKPETAPVETDDVPPA